ncbi:MAG: hypothetical protein K8U57_11115 [Planctomycetes bacterium]|nr:hypothetical protein [Planctomycetota bacterium]
MGKFIDLTGQQFGSWKVLRRDDSNPEPMAYWICRCECGRTKSVSGKNLRSGKSQKCVRCADKTRSGPVRYQAGDRIGNWTILRRDKYATGYLCRCDCGFEAVRQIGNLGGGKTSECKACWIAKHRVPVRKKKQPRTDRTIWSAEQLSLLGTDTDQATAAKVGRTEQAVQLKRRRRKIPPFRP